MPLLQVAEAEVRFGGVHALRGVNLDVDARHRHRSHRPQRRRQDHLLQRHLRAADPQRRPDHLRRHRHDRAQAPQARPPAILALRRGPFGRVLVAAKDSEAACATLGLSLTTTKLVVFTLSAAMAGVAGALFAAAEAVVGGTSFEMFESLLILAVVAIGGASVCSRGPGRRAGHRLPARQRPGRLHRRRHRGPRLLPGRRAAPGLLPLPSVVERPGGPRGTPAPAGVEDRAGTLAGTRAA